MTFDGIESCSRHDHGCEPAGGHGDGIIRQTDRRQSDDAGRPYQGQGPIVESRAMAARRRVAAYREERSIGATNEGGTFDDVPFATACSLPQALANSSE